MAVEPRPWDEIRDMFRRISAELFTDAAAARAHAVDAQQRAQRSRIRSEALRSAAVEERARGRGSLR
jgi:hypothetical protein